MVLPISDPGSPGFQIIAAILANPAVLGLTSPADIIQILSSLTTTVNTSTVPSMSPQSSALQPQSANAQAAPVASPPFALPNAPLEASSHCATSSLLPTESVALPAHQQLQSHQLGGSGGDH
jgi:hypothetical protein